MDGVDVVVVLVVVVFLVGSVVYIGGGFIG